MADVQCVNCTQIRPDAKERTVQKATGAAKRVLCDDCAAKVNETYPVQGIRTEPEPKDEQPLAVEEAPAAKSTTRNRRGG
jgi:hypothetical protein